MGYCTDLWGWAVPYIFLDFHVQYLSFVLQNLSEPFEALVPLLHKTEVLHMKIKENVGYRPPP